VEEPIFASIIDHQRKADKKEMKEDALGIG
jgi:hypothetical protein